MWELVILLLLFVLHVPSWLELLFISKVRFIYYELSFYNLEYSLNFKSSFSFINIVNIAAIVINIEEYKKGPIVPWIKEKYYIDGKIIDKKNDRPLFIL